jgi:hypothetical protein
MVEALLALLRAGGVPDPTAAWAVDIVSLYITGVAYERSIYAAREWTPEQESAFHDSVHQAFAGVSPERFPSLSRTLPYMTAGTPDERFRFGIDVLINGLLNTPPPLPATGPDPARPAQP